MKIRIQKNDFQSRHSPKKKVADIEYKHQKINKTQESKNMLKTNHHSKQGPTMWVEIRAHDEERRIQMDSALEMKE
jgi:hypothetical protein